MRKRGLAVLLVLCMVLGMMPIMSHAASQQVITNKNDISGSVFAKSKDLANVLDSIFTGNTQVPFVCSHADTCDSVIEASCVTEGYSGLFCKMCGAMLETYEVLPADGVHDLTYSGYGSTLTETCVNCDHTETARVCAPEDYYLYTGEPVTPATIEYSANWLGGELEIGYTDNIEIGVGNAAIQKNGAKASVSFWIEEHEIVASGSCGENLTWKLDNNNHLTISGYGEMTSCEWKYGYRVDSVSLPDGLTNICDGAFSDYDYLFSVEIPDSVVEIGYQAFWSCNKLESVSMPDSLIEIGASAFTGCAFAEINIPNTVKDIGEGAFYGCELLKTVILPPCVSIGEYAFYNSVEDVYICGGIPDDFSEKIFENEEGTTGLAVTIHHSEMYPEWTERAWNQITTEIWANDDHMDCVEVVAPTCYSGYDRHYCSRCYEEWRDNYVDPVEEHLLQYYSVENTIVETCANGCELKETAKIILESTFNVYTGEELTPASAVYSDGWQGGKLQVQYANNINPGEATVSLLGQDCVAEDTFCIVESQIVDQGVCGDKIEWCLDEDGTLTLFGSGEMDNWYTDAYGYLFGENYDFDAEEFAPWYDYRSDIYSLKICGDITSVGMGAFKDLAYISEVEFCDSVRNVGNAAFWNCSSLISVMLPESVSSIGEFAFAVCESLEYVSLGSKLSDVGNGAFFADSKLTDVFFGGSEAQWNNISFEGEELELMSAQFHDHSLGGSLSGKIYWYFDFDDKKLRIDRCSSDAFDNDSGLETAFVSFAENVEYIEFGAGVTKIEAGGFADCTNVKGLFVDAGNECYFVSDNIVYQEATKVEAGAEDGAVIETVDTSLVMCVATATELNVPEYVGSIWPDAFAACSCLKSIYFENDAPSVWQDYFWPDLFPKSPDITIYYYSDTTGWDASCWAPYTKICIEREPEHVVEVESNVGDTDEEIWTVSDDGKTITVCYDNACVLFVECVDGNLLRLTAIPDDNGGYSFDISELAEGDMVIIVVKGDVDMDGTLEGSEVVQIKAAQLGKLDTFTATQNMVADLNGDGIISGAEVVQVKAAQLGKLDLSW